MTCHFNVEPVKLITAGISGIKHLVLWYTHCTQTSRSYIYSVTSTNLFLKDTHMEKFTQVTFNTRTCKNKSWLSLIICYHNQWKFIIPLSYNYKILQFNKEYRNLNIHWGKFLRWFMKPRKPEIAGTLSAIFLVKTPRYNCCFVLLT